MFRRWRRSGPPPSSQAFVDVGFWGGAVPGNSTELRPLHEAGVFGFKSFLVHSGVDEFPPLSPAELEKDLAELAAFGALMLVHAEDAGTIDRAPHPAGKTYASFLASRPDGAETAAIADVVDRARSTGARVHILHLSSADALAEIAEAKAAGVRLTVETCPHYLTLTAEAFRTEPPPSNAVRPSEGKPTVSCSGPAWPTERSTASSPTTRPARRS